jgi:DNA-binding CsgD family transcriptional regulator
MEKVAGHLPADLPADSPPASFVLAVRGLARLQADDLAAAFPLLRRAVDQLRRADLGVPESLTAGLISVSIADYAALEQWSKAAVAHCRRHGIVGRLGVALRLLSVAQMAGRAAYRDAAASLDEALRLAVDMGQERTGNQIQCGQAVLAALVGDEQRCRDLAQQCIATATAHDDNVAAAIGNWAIGLLDLGLGRYEDALTRLEAVNPRGHSFAVQFGADLVEAAARAGQPERAAKALAHVEDWAACSGDFWIRAAALRSRALVSQDRDAGEHYAAAADLAAAAGQPYEQGRTELLYGEWLRRTRRRGEARARLRSAVELFDRIGAIPWAKRARVELRAAGDTGTAQPPGSGRLARLTPQERQVVQRAAAGASNREIAAELFLSHRTVGYHLYKAFPKLGIASRMELTKLATDWSAD